MKKIDISEKQILYHGSKGKIQGDISPISPNPSRKTHPSDFGEGFYLGQNLAQAKGVCIENENPYIYKMRLSLDKISPQKILILTDEQWLYTVISFRNKNNDIGKTDFANKIRNIIDKYDVVIGTIADDRMVSAMTAFRNGEISDEGLMACLKYIDYGNQFVLKSEFACKQIEILREKELKGLEAENARDDMYNNRRKSTNIISEMERKYRRKGLYIDEIYAKIERNELLAENIFTGLPDLSVPKT